ncbi:MAG: hypothetical protein WCH99_17025 [Verrucomicrobiota bacterium]
MAWPTPQDYNEAVQNPRFAFVDTDLRSGQPELTALGLPRPISGNFACVYKIQTGSERWAARCFISEVSDQQRRYEAISEYLAKARLPYTVPFTYMPAGIKVQGRNFPLLKMQWVHGESLNMFVSRSLKYPDTLLSLAKVWSQMVADLKAASVAHGDLQHGNVVVVGDQLRLIDYDGMFVPALAGKQSNELGHRNYQLPTRSGWDFGPHLDNFSAWVIYVSLVALAVHPELWSTHSGGDECLIFRREDFVQPENSAILRDLNSSSNSQLRLLVELFTNLFGLHPRDVPSLDGRIAITVESSTRIISPPSGTSWLDDHVGARATPEKQNATETNQVRAEEPPNPDPTWIVESIMDAKPVEALQFQGNTKPVRILILGSMSILILIQLLGSIPMSEFSVVASCVLGLNLLFCIIRYKQDPSLVEFEGFKKATKAFTRQLREHQTVIDSIIAEQQRVQERIAAGERAIEVKKRRMVAAFQSDLNKEMAEFTSRIQQISQRRRDTNASENTKLNSIQSGIGNQIADLDRKIASINQREADEKSTRLTAVQNNYVQYILNSRYVSNSSIPGIGAAYTSRLVQSGYATAGDINWGVGRVSGIGPARQKALINWRQEIEQYARQNAPGLSAQERKSIESKYQVERQTLNSTKQQLKKQFDDQVAGVRQYFEDLRRSMDQEEQQIKTASNQKKNQMQQNHKAEVARLDAEVLPVRNQAAPTLNELSDKLSNARKQVFSVRWQAAKKEKEGRRFASLRFQDYLRKINTP